MKPYHTIIVFLVLIGSALACSVYEYRRAEDNIVRDMNQALAQTLKDKREGWLTPDTITDYRSHLKIEELRTHSIIYYAMDGRNRGLCSHRMRWQKADKAMEFQGFANCSMASVLLMSDQRASLSLSLLSVLWMVCALVYFRKHRAGTTLLGGMIYREGTQSFYDLRHREIKLTPMQAQLMRMFYAADNHTLDKRQICDALWPKKPDASDTLYTLVKRLKPIVEEKGHLRIVSDRGTGYRLEASR